MCMSMDLVQYGMIVLQTILTVVELTTLIHVGDCGWPSLMRANLSYLCYGDWSLIFTTVT